MFTGGAAVYRTCVNMCERMQQQMTNVGTLYKYKKNIYVGEYIRMCICLCLRLIMFIYMLYIHVESRRTCLRQGVAWMWEACRR